MAHRTACRAGTRRGQAILVVVALICTSGLACDTSSSPPNVLLVVLDTVRADAVGGTFNQRPVTPHFDRIAAEGARFENAYATAPWTLPSHATIFTGLAPSQHHAVHENFVLGDKYITLAEMLVRRGYTTYGISSNPWVTRGRGFAQGFDEFVAAYSDLEDLADKGAARATEYAIDFLSRTAQSDRPFFLFVNYLEAHLPYAPPEAGFEALGIPAESLSRRVFTIEQAEEIITGERKATEDELDLARTLYRCEIAYQDRQLGKLFDALRGHDLLDKTLIVLTADHGELLGGEGLMGHEFSLSDDLLRVPLVLRYPDRIKAGQSVTLPVSHLDVVPTLLDILGEPEAAAMLEGKSLLATHELSRERPLIAEYSEPKTLINQYWASRHPEFDSEPFAVSLRSLRRGSKKLIESTRGEVTLIDRDPSAPDGNDPARENLVLEMREELAQWIARLSDPAE